MSEAGENAGLVAGFRRLRPAVHEWLARDLAGPPMEYTRAFADLMFAYAFARLAAKQDADEAACEATEVLTTSPQSAHGWLLRMFRYRIDKALEGKPNSGFIPEDMEPRLPQGVSRNAPIILEQYVTRVGQSISGILDPDSTANQFEEFTKELSPLMYRVSELRKLRDPVEIANFAREMLDDAPAIDPVKRAEVWGCVLPFVARAGTEIVSQLLQEVPEVVSQAALVPSPNTFALRQVVVRAIELAAAMPDGRYLPSLIDAADVLMRSTKDATHRTLLLGKIGWACLRWFRRLGAVEEANQFLDATRDWWAKRTAWDVQMRRMSDAEQLAIVTATAEAGLRRFVGQPEADQILADVVTAASFGSLDPRATADTFVGIASALALWPVTETFEKLTDLLSRIGRVRGQFTTERYFSRLHLKMAESIVLAFPAVRGT